MGHVLAECGKCHARYDVRGISVGTQLRCRCGAGFEVPAIPATSAQAEMISCPACGAAVAYGSSSCSYCRAPLAVASCPRCFGMMSTGARFCPHCGSAALNPVLSLERQTSRRCPRCVDHPTLRGCVVGETFMERCKTCGGVFVETQAFDAIVEDEDRRAVVDASLVEQPLTDVRDPVQYVPCPECETLMNRTNFGRRSGIIVDVCKNHGTWFDADELRRVIAFVKSGGLDKARALELDALKAQVAHQRSMSQQLGGSGGVRGGAGWDSSDFGAIDITDLCELVVGFLGLFRK